MTRPIKFRGRTKRGKLVHGDLRHMVETEGIGCLVASTRHYVTVGDIEVDPESVAQLVGYDCDGREVYEGDVCLYPDGSEFTTAIFSHPETIKSCLLKEAQT